jgi:hypothetical protein
MNDVIKTQRATTVSLLVLTAVAAAIFAQRGATARALRFIEPLVVANHLLHVDPALPVRLRDARPGSYVFNDPLGPWTLQVFLEDSNISNECRQTGFIAQDCRYSFVVRTQFIRYISSMSAEGRGVHDHRLRFQRYDGELRYFWLSPGASAGDMLNELGIAALVQSRLEPLGLNEESVSDGYRALRIKHESNNVTVPVLGIQASAPVALSIITVMCIAGSGLLMLAYRQIARGYPHNTGDSDDVTDGIRLWRHLKVAEKVAGGPSIAILAAGDLIACTSAAVTSTLLLLESARSTGLDKPLGVFAVFVFMMSVAPTAGATCYCAAVMRERARTPCNSLPPHETEELSRETGAG